MTREKASEVLKRSQKIISPISPLHEAIGVALDQLDAGATDTDAGDKSISCTRENDLISRQQAIDALTEYGNGRAVFISVGEAVIRIEQLPSAEPDIVRCRDCRYYNSEEKECLDLMGHGRRWEEDDFCSYAEKRTDE